MHNTIKVLLIYICNLFTTAINETYLLIKLALDWFQLVKIQHSSSEKETKTARF